MRGKGEGGWMGALLTIGSLLILALAEMIEEMIKEVIKKQDQKADLL